MAAPPALENEEFGDGVAAAAAAGGAGGRAAGEGGTQRPHKKHAARSTVPFQNPASYYKELATFLKYIVSRFKNFEERAPVGVFTSFLLFLAQDRTVDGNGTSSTP